jgi:ABC-type dipeptide/oligopeptide/nickel transport system permease component
MNVSILLSLSISFIIMTIYYFNVKDKLNRYSSVGYSIFLTIFSFVFILITVILYLFIQTILNSKQIYPRSLAGRQYRKPLISDYQSPESVYNTSIPKKIPRFNDTFFNENFTNLFRRPNKVARSPNDIYIKSRYQGDIRPPYNPPNIFWE